MQRLDGGDDPLQLLLLVDGRARTRLDPDDVERVGTLVDESCRCLRKASKSQYCPPSKNESGVRLRMAITMARWVTSNRWAPSSSSTRRRYTPPPADRSGSRVLLDALRDGGDEVRPGGLDGDDQTTEAQPDAGVGHRRAGDLVTLGRPDPPRPPAVGHCGRHLGVGRAAPRRHEQIDSAHAGPAQGLEERLGPGSTVDDQHRGSLSAPEVDPREQGRPRLRRSPQRQGGGDERGESEEGGEHGDRPQPEAAGERRGADGHGQEPHVARAQLTERDRGSDPGHGGHPGDQPGCGGVQQCGRSTADEPGRDACREAPGHDQPGRRPGDQVGRQRAHRQTAEGADEDGGHSQLRSRSDGQRIHEDGRTWQQPAQGRGHDEDADRGRHGEPEADGAHEQRVDEHQGGHGQGQQAHSRRGPAEDEGGGREPGHGPGPQHRRLESGDEGEEADDTQGHGPAGPEA
ncbi:MAG: hypothetical protein WKF43_08825 [Acidimicrobiales bacterium]